MRFNATLFAIFLFVSFYFLPQKTIGTTVRTTLKKALLKKLITVEATGVGGACGKCLKVNITNTSADELVLEIDPGLIFSPQDSTYSSLVTYGYDSFTVSASSKKMVVLQTYSGKSYSLCPEPQMQFQYTKQGDSLLLKILKYVKDNSIDKYLAQRAVWVSTNKHCIGTVFSKEFPRMSEGLMKFLSVVKRVKMPVFYTEDKIEFIYGRPIIVKNATKVYVSLYYGNDGYRHMYVKIFKEDGELYKKVEPDEMIDKEGHLLTVEFDVQKDPKGIYDVELCDETTSVWMKKRVRVGVNPCDSN